MSSFSFSLSAATGESAAHHRHQASLERILDLSVVMLSAAERADADATFNSLISHAEPLQGTSPYKKATLVRLTYEHARSKDTFLRQFFLFVDHNSHSDDDIQPVFEDGLARFQGFVSQGFVSQTSAPSLKREAEGVIDSFAEYLFQNFFLPMKTAGAKTAQPSAASLSAPALENVVGTPARLSTLRWDCLIRDHNRCVVTRTFNIDEAITRERRDPKNYKDDDGKLLASDLQPFSDLEVAHIIPHSIMSAKTVDGQLQLSGSKKMALSVLDMFDPGIVHLIKGPNIDHPSNAISLRSDAHTRFGLFQISFEALSEEQHTYRIHGRGAVTSRVFNLPMTRTLLLSPNRTINPPSVKLFALHRAIAIILELSAAGEYIDRIIHHMEETWVRSDGTVELGRIVALKLDGWLDGVAA
ncbi:hypothetical protein FQN50_000287 [Emmonsiellopsis sp. PD_5]|nr:hypothetical protein FQN50_000287 [Emmonsiellopsis sp. PD_5]